MANLPTKQLRGVKDLLKDAVDAGVDTTEQVHLALARKPYAVLEKISLIAAPVHVVERIQHTITVGVYQSIRTINALSAVVATEVIDRIERSADKKNKY
ncbi:MAG TPA: hypothetical protein VNW52_03425 [Burkholderiaceae bacterium]|jgi:hypothetical protein|nr:hypothetical protein [Burkholderiaceae bacterium]